MRKVYLKSMLLLCALIVGSMNVWAEDVAAYTFATAQSSSNTAYASNYTVTISGLSWSVPGNQNFSGYVRIGGKSLSNVDRVIKSNGSISDELTKITFNHNGKSNTNLTVNSIKLTVASNSDFSSVIEEITKTPSISVGTSGSFNFTPGENDDKVTSWGTSRYYKFTINVSNSVNTNYGLDVTSIVFYKAGSSEPSISLGSNSVNAPETAVSTTSIEVTYNNLTNYDADVIFYEENGTDAATYDHSWLTAEINASTKNLDYSITANTGAARVAYLRVYALGDEGEVESSLITITQDKKSVTSPEFNLDGGSYMQGTNITLSSAGNTIYYNLTTDGSTPGNPTNASTQYSGAIALGSGTTKIKAIAYDTYGNTSSVVTRTYTGIALASTPFSWTGTKTAGKTDLAAKTGVTLSLADDYAASNAPYRLKFDGTSKYVTIYTDKKPEMVYFTAKLFNAASTGSKIKVQGSADGINFTDVEEFTVKGAANATFVFSTSNAFAATHRAVKLVMSSKDQNVAVGTICVSCIPVAISAYEWATYVTPYALDFEGLSGIKAYIVTGHNAAWTAIEKTQMTGTVPAGTPLLLEGATTNVPVVASSSTDVSGNKLVAGDGTEDGVSYEAGKTKYVLGVSASDEAEFQKIVSGTPATVPVGKAYLLFNEASAAPSALRLEDEENNATDIETIEASDKAIKFIENGQLLIKREGITYDALGRIVR